MLGESQLSRDSNLPLVKENTLNRFKVFSFLIQGPRDIRISAFRVNGGLGL